MTAQEMNQLFLSLYDKFMTNGAPPLGDLQKSQFLTLAQDNLIKRRLNPRHGDTFEETEKRALEFSELIRSAELTNPADLASSQTGVMPNGQFWNIPTNTFYVISERVDIEYNEDNPCYSDGKKENVMVVPVSHDEFMANVDNPYEMPFDGEIWRLKFSKIDDEYVHELITDGSYTINNYKLRYLKYPNPIITDALTTGSIRGETAQTDCELQESIHEEIVREAVRLAEASVEDPQGYQFENNESKLSE